MFHFQLFRNPDGVVLLCIAALLDEVGRDEVGREGMKWEVGQKGESCIQTRNLLTFHDELRILCDVEHCPSCEDGVVNF
jgi:hypothetical protein